MHYLRFVLIVHKIIACYYFFLLKNSLDSWPKEIALIALQIKQFYHLHVQILQRMEMEIMIACN